jgi:hypothetical protein
VCCQHSACCCFAYCAAVFVLHAEPPPGQLPSLAAAHPEAYTALIDCWLRMPVLPAKSMLVPGPLLLHASPWRGSQAALDSTAAVAGLASALTSLVKRAVQLIRSASDLQSQQAAAATGEADAAAAYFPAAAHIIAVEWIARQARMSTNWFESLDTAAAGAGNAVGSSSSQAAVCAVLLAVVFARSLAQLADAMEAAGPEVYYKSLLGRPVFRMRWLNEPADASDTFCTRFISHCGREDLHSAEAQWQVWQLAVLVTTKDLWAAFKSVGIAPSAAAAGQPAAAAAAASTSAARETLAACGEPQESSGSSSSTVSTSNSNGRSAGQPVKWGYLLRLQQCSPQWAAAVAAYEANQPSREEVQAGVLPSSGAAAEQHSQRYAEAISLCRALAAAAPLPVVCNNPDCENTEGVSEAAAASKACAGCRCRYCSVACQRAEWRRHKGACRRMAAAGQACV